MGSLAFVGLWSLGCSGMPGQTPTTPEPAPATDQPAPAPAPEADEPEREDLCTDEPYAKRCDQACKDASATATKTTCKDEIAAYTDSTSAEKATLTTCLTACKAAGDDATCVQAVSHDACECELTCYKALPPPELKKARAMERCLRKALTDACK